MVVVQPITVRVPKNLHLSMRMIASFDGSTIQSLVQRALRREVVRRLRAASDELRQAHAMMARAPEMADKE